MVNGSDQGHLEGALALLSGFGDRVSGFRADVRSSRQVNQLVEATLDRFGSIGVLVNCAGVISSSPVLELPEEEWDRIMDTNLKGAFLLSKVAARAMVEAGQGGRIVNVASIAGISPRAGVAHYAASKAGLIALTRTMALELGPRGITVNAVAPGLILASDKSVVPSQRFLESFAKGVPLGRIGDTRDVTGAILFLASDSAGYITGEVITIDGGATAGRFFLPSQD